MTAQIWLIRHGETEWSRDLRHTGRTNLPLTVRGEQQAIQAGAELRAATQTDASPSAHSREVHPSLVLCSPLLRARRTAELAGLVPDAFEDDLMEWDYGAWEGITTAEIRAVRAEPTWLIWDEPIPAGDTPGEQLADVALRAARVISSCLPALSSGNDCVLVAHGHVLRILTATWLGLSPDAARFFALDPARLSSLGFEHEQRVIRSWNA
jgi:broad specificity phosphatase PhoE